MKIDLLECILILIVVVVFYVIASLFSQCSRQRTIITTNITAAEFIASQPDIDIDMSHTPADKFNKPPIKHKGWDL